MDIQNGVAVAVLLIGLAALLYQVIKVNEGLAPAASLIDESLHDLALVCLGLALPLRQTAARDALVACFTLLLAVYLAKRHLPRTHS